MKPGNLVKFVDRYEKQQGRMFLVLGRDDLTIYKNYSDDSKWAKWQIVDMANGHVMHQIGRDLEVVQ